MSSVVSNLSDFSQNLELPIINSRNLFKPNSQYFIGANTKDLPYKKHDNVNAIFRDKSNKHLRVNLQFQQYLFTKDDHQPHTANNYGMGIVSFVGDKGTGKSLLADSILSQDYGKVLRGFSKNQSEIINSSHYDYQGYDSNPIHFFVHRKNADKDAFLWLYFISSVMILNLKQNDSSQYRHFLKNLKYVTKNFKTNQGQLSKPKLIIAFKNSKTSIPDKDDVNEFLDKIEETDLFERNIATINFPYPGRQSVKQRQLLDVPLAELSPDYLASVKKLSHMLKASAPKNIMGNKITPKFLSYILDATTNEINSTGLTSVSTQKIWADIMEEYGVGYHNFYLKEYTQRLASQFNDQKPRTQYEVYSTLNKIKRQTDKKASGFQNLKGDPTFQKYRRKVQQHVASKQQQIINVTLAKSENENQKLANSLFTGMNGNNFKKKIDEFNAVSAFQTSKANTLIDSFDMVIGDNYIETASGPINVSNSTISKNKSSKIESRLGELASRQAQLEQIQRKISMSKLNLPTINDEQYQRELAILQNENKAKEHQLQQRQADYQKLKKSSKSAHRDYQLEKEEQQLKRFYEEIERNKQQKQRLMKQKDKFIKDKTYELNSRLKLQSQRAGRYQTLLKSNLSVQKATAGAKDTCCIIM